MNRQNSKNKSVNYFVEKTSTEITDVDLGGRAVDSDEPEGTDDQTSDSAACEECDIDSNFGDNVIPVAPKISKIDQVEEEVMQKYKERQGKQLYIRFPHTVPETLEALEEKVRVLTPLVVKVHKPRQRHVRFCLADFATQADRDAALNNLKKSIKNGDLKKYVVSIPRTESSDFLKELVKRKIKSIENKKAKIRLKKASKKSQKENNFTSTVIVSNLPKNSSVLQIRELFVNAVDINIKPAKEKLHNGKGLAAITFPTTLDARNAIKKKLSLEGNELVLKFDNKNLKKKKSKHTNSKNVEKGLESESKLKKGIEPKTRATKGSIRRQKTNKRKIVNNNAVENNPKVATK